MPQKKVYKFATFTEYPELKGILEEKLKELGDIVIENHITLSEPNYHAKITSITSLMW